MWNLSSFSHNKVWVSSDIPTTSMWLPDVVTCNSLMWCFSAAQKLVISFTKGWLCVWYALLQRSRCLIFFSFLLICSSVATTTSDNQAKEGAALDQPIRCTLWPRTRHQSSFPAWSKPSPPDNAVWFGRERWSVDPTCHFHHFLSKQKHWKPLPWPMILLCHFMQRQTHVKSWMLTTFNFSPFCTKIWGKLYSHVSSYQEEDERS